VGERLTVLSTTWPAATQRARDLAAESGRARLLTGNRVVVPEPLFDATGEKDMKTAIQTFRSSAKKLNELRLKANVITGL
jgi:hypothetical protein